MRKIIDGIVLVSLALFSVAYSVSTPFRDAIIAEVQLVRSRPLAENARVVPQEVRHAVVGGCPATIRFRVGAIDSRFDVSQPEVLAAAQAAAKEWNDAAGAELLAASDDLNAMPISLIYDDRQKLAMEINDEEGSLKNQKDRFAFLKQKYDTLNQSIEDQTAAYRQLGDQYTKAAKKFESDVRAAEADPNSYDQAKYDDLQKERKKVQGLYNDLEAKRQAINDAIDELNTLAKNANLAGTTLNRQVDVYNTSVTEKRQITEDFAGVYYSDRRIEVYQFLSADELRDVLVHEMGHALGFEHSTDPHSIMYPDSQEKQSLTAADQQMAKDLCK